MGLYFGKLLGDAAHIWEKIRKRRRWNGEHVKEKKTIESKKIKRSKIGQNYAKKGTLRANNDLGNKFNFQKGEIWLTERNT
jgi:hypothetical protein